MLSVRQELYDYIKGSPVYLITLAGEDITVTITNLGCAITSISIPDRDGLSRNIVAGFDDLSQYGQNEHYLGCVVGRYVNRIGHGRFSLDGGTVQLTLNDGLNHLHGGFEGFNKRIWTVAGMIREEGEAGVVFEYTSMDGEEGYPGNLRVRITYLLSAEGALSIRYEAVTDKPTPVNLSNHSYFNLTGFTCPLVTDHILRVHASRYTEKSAINLPTGKIIGLAGTPLDFTRPKRLGDIIDRIPIDGGLDHNYVLDRPEDRDIPEGRNIPEGYDAPGTRPDPGELVVAAELYEPVSGRVVRVMTDQPGLQVYTANWWDGTLKGAAGHLYERHGAVALETQAFPDGPNHPEFPNTILNPGDIYRSTTIFSFGVM
jgi:aldose 1-epimerase